MARKSAVAGQRTTNRRRKERRPFIPEGTLTNPEEVAAPTQAASGPAFVRRPLKAAATTVGVPISADYQYVGRDIRKIIITTGGLVLMLAALSFIIR